VTDRSVVGNDCRGWPSPPLNRLKTSRGLPGRCVREEELEEECRGEHKMGEKNPEENSHMEIPTAYSHASTASHSPLKTGEHVLRLTPLHTKRYILWGNFKGRINYLSKQRGGWWWWWWGTTKPLRVVIQSEGRERERERESWDRLVFTEIILQCRISTVSGFHVEDENEMCWTKTGGGNTAINKHNATWIPTCFGFERRPNSSFLLVFGGRGLEVTKTHLAPRLRQRTPRAPRVEGVAKTRSIRGGVFFKFYT